MSAIDTSLCYTGYGSLTSCKLCGEIVGEEHDTENHKPGCPVVILEGLMVRATYSHHDTDGNNYPYEARESETFRTMGDAVDWVIHECKSGVKDRHTWGHTLGGLEYVFDLKETDLHAKSVDFVDKTVEAILARREAEKAAQELANMKAALVSKYKAERKHIENLKAHLTPEGYDTLVADLNAKYPEEAKNGQ